MSDDRVADLARRINATDSPKAVVHVAGGGTEVFPMLLARGGGSNTLLAGRILYAPDDFRQALGRNPDRFVEASVARGLAMAAFRHALKVRGDLAPESAFGLGSTSKLATGEGEREGRTHQIHAAVQTSDSTYSWSFTLPAGNDRAWEERINALFLLNLLAFVKVGSGYLPLEHDGREVPPESISSTVGRCEPAIGEVLVGVRRWVALEFPHRMVVGEHPAWTVADQGVPKYLAGRFRTVFGEHAVFTSEDQGPPRLLLPGSFRPLHDGHVAMAETASRLTGLPCAYELSVIHPEKPPLDCRVIQSRRKDFIRYQFPGRTCRLYLTNAPTYVEKARLFPGCTFVVGHDTALRIVDPRFYGGPEARDAAFDELERLGARFLVFGRVDDSGEFRDFSPEEFEHPVAGFLARVATPIPGHIFRQDISSTQIRRLFGGDFP